MTKNIVSVKSGTTAAGAIEVMRKKNIGAVLIRKKGKFTGIFTERDILERLDPKDPVKFMEADVSRVMTRSIVTVDHEKTYLKSMELMGKHRIKHLPVTVKGKIKGMISLRDVLNEYRKQLESELLGRKLELEDNLKKISESERKFRTVFDNSAVAIILADNREKIVAWNPLAAKLLGMRAEKLVKMKLKDLYPPEEWERIRSLNIKKLGLKYHIETKMINARGNKIEVDVSLSVLKDNEGKMGGLIGIIRDITERKRAEEALRVAYERLKETQTQLIQAEKLYAVGQLASGVAHEVRNPLEIILQGINFLEKTMSFNEKDPFMVFEMMKDGVERASGIINSLLDFSKASELKLDYHDINDILSTAIKLVDAKIKEAHINLIKNFGRNLPRIKIDKNKISQVFINMFINSVYATRARGVIRVKTYMETMKKNMASLGNSENVLFKKGEKAVIVEIEDTGTGIDKSDIKKIFDPFFTTKGPKSGAGLGLSVSHNILRMHSAAIDVKSRKGKGTRMIVYFKTGGGEITWIRKEYS